MAHKFLKDLKEGELVEDIYLVREKSFDTTRTGSQYISLELVDRSGMVDAKKWDASKTLFDSFNIDDFIKVKAKVEFYKKYPQLKLDTIEKVASEEPDIALYIPTVNADRNKLFSQYMSYVTSLKDPHLKTLFQNIFSDKETADKFKKSPSATDFHHPYIGGLLEHSLSCVELAELVSSKYKDINRDVLVAGAALHDIGKIEEFSFRKTFYYSDKGRLIGHIVLGANFIAKQIEKIDGFPEILRDILLHIIISHHGEHEWGSPKRPMCLEAVVLHYIDNLDAKVNGFKHFVETFNQDVDTNWTKHSKMFGEFLYKGNLLT